MAYGRKGMEVELIFWCPVNLFSNVDKDRLQNSIKIEGFVHFEQKINSY